MKNVFNDEAFMWGLIAILMAGAVMMALLAYEYVSAFCGVCWMAVCVLNVRSARRTARLNRQLKDAERKIATLKQLVETMETFYRKDAEVEGKEGKV